MKEQVTNNSLLSFTPILVAELNVDNTTMVAISDGSFSRIKLQDKFHPCYLTCKEIFQA